MAEHDDEPPVTEGEPAFILDHPREPHAMPYLHADVNVFGAGVVELGRVTRQRPPRVAA